MNKEKTLDKIKEKKPYNICEDWEVSRASFDFVINICCGETIPSFLEIKTKKIEELKIIYKDFPFEGLDIINMISEINKERWKLDYNNNLTLIINKLEKRFSKKKNKEIYKEFYLQKITFELFNEKKVLENLDIGYKRKYQKFLASIKEKYYVFPVRDPFTNPFITNPKELYLSKTTYYY